VVSEHNEARILAAFAEMNQGRVTNETGRAIYDVIKEIDNYSGPGTSLVATSDGILACRRQVPRAVAGGTVPVSACGCRLFGPRHATCAYS
jgi:hypothetical protein